jgi:hypothetical protein
MNDPKFAVGDQVILSEHQAFTDANGVEYPKHWDPNMLQYVGKTAIITGVMGNLNSRSFPCPLYSVGIDGGTWSWREINMTPVKVVGKTTVPTEAPCKQCGRKNDLGIHKCWYCECQNPTS